MKAKERGGLQDDRGTDQPVRPQEERTHASDDATGRRRLGARFRVRLRMSNCCLRSTDSATTDRAPPGPASWAIVVSRWRTRAARSRARQSYQDGNVRKS